MRTPTARIIVTHYPALNAYVVQMEHALSNGRRVNTTGRAATAAAAVMQAWERRTFTLATSTSRD